MRKGQTLDSFMPSRSEPRKRDLVPHRNDPRCVGRGCSERAECKRYQRAVFEAAHDGAQKGRVLMMNMADSDGVCRRKV